MKKLTFVLSLSLILTACGGLRGKSNLVPPAPINPSVVSTSQVDWSVKAGAATEKGADLRFEIAEDNMGTLYIAGSSGGVAAINSATGQKLWERNVGKLYSGITYQDGVLLVGRKDGHLAALSANNGEILWTRKLLGVPAATPISDGRLAIIRTLAGVVETFDLHSGEPAWAYLMNAPELTLQGGAAPAIAGDRLIIPGELGRLAAVTLQHGEELWEIVLSNPKNASFSGRLRDIDAPLIITPRHIFAGELRAGVSAITHNGEILWQAGEGVYSGMAFDGDTIYAVEEDSSVRALAAATGEEKWLNVELTGRFLTKPVILQGRIVVGDYEGYVHLIDATTGRVTSSTQVAKSKFLPDIKAIGGAVLLQDVQGNLYKVSI